MGGNVGVISDVAAREAPEVAAESVQARVELLEDDGLGLDFTDLLGDDALGHLLEDEETLLNDLDALGVADDFLLLHDLDGAFAEVAVVVVVGAVEVVETTEGADSTVVIEGVRATGSYRMALSVRSTPGKYI